MRSKEFRIDSKKNLQFSKDYISHQKNKNNIERLHAKHRFWL
jgi:hypothetical protein